MADKELVYEVREGSIVLGQFSSQTKAKAFLKECKAQGKKVSIVTSFIKPKATKKAVLKPKKTVPRKSEPMKVEPKPKKAEPKPKPKVTLGTSIGMWYKEQFPTDNLGPYVSDIAFSDLYDRMCAGEGIYDLIGVGDSIVRERVCDKLAELKGVSYDEIYSLIMGRRKSIPMPGMVAPQPARPEPKRSKPTVIRGEPPKAEPKKVEHKPKVRPKTKARSKVNKSKFSEDTRYTGRGILDFCSLLFGDFIYIHRSRWASFDPAHISLVEFDFGKDTVFGLPANNDDVAIFVGHFEENIDPKETYEVKEYMDRLDFIGRSGKFSVPFVDMKMSRVPPFEQEAEYDLDYLALRESIRRFKKMSGKYDEITLYGDGSDLYVSAENNDYHFIADVGDGGSVVISSYSFDYVDSMLSKLKKIGCPARLGMSNDYPLAVSTSTTYFDVLFMIAPTRKK